MINQFIRFGKKAEFIRWIWYYLKRYNGKVNLNHKITNNLIAGLNLQYTMRDGNRRDDGQYYNAMEMYSISQIYAADSTLLDRPSELGRSYTNPLINELPGYYVNNIRSNRLFSNLFLDWEIVKGLHLKSVLGIDNNTRRQGSYEDYMTKNLFQASLGSKFSVENGSVN